MSITSLVTLTVPESRADDIAAMWQELGGLLDGLPGFRGATLNRARTAEAGKARFINVASWESEDDWRAAIGEGVIGSGFPDWIEVQGELLDAVVTLPAATATTAGRVNNYAEMAYPSGKIIAHLKDPATIKAAIGALEDAGVDLQDIAAFHGDEALAKMKLFGGETQNIFSKMVFKVRASSQVGRVFKHTIGVLQSGGAYLTVACEDRAAALRVRDLLAPVGGTRMHYFAQWTIETFADRA